MYRHSDRRISISDKFLVALSPNSDWTKKKVLIEKHHIGYSSCRVTKEFVVFPFTYVWTLAPRKIEIKRTISNSTKLTKPKWINQLIDLFLTKISRQRPIGPYWRARRPFWFFPPSYSPPSNWKLCCLDHHCDQRSKVNRQLFTAKGNCLHRKTLFCSLVNKGESFGFYVGF